MASPTASAPRQELAHLRTVLLAGRGPGASAQEVAAHTRDRRWLGELPASRELERVAHQAMLARTGATFSSFSAFGRFLESTLRAVAIGAAAMLIVRSILRGLLTK